jgi:hypothetical protein
MSNKLVTMLESWGAKFASGTKAVIAEEQKLRPLEKVVDAVITTVDPALGATLSGLLSVVGNVEQVATAVGASTGAGSQKLAVAIPGVEQAILADPLFKGKTISNLTLWNSAVEAITSALANLANSVQSSVPSTVVAATPAAATA